MEKTHARNIAGKRIKQARQMASPKITQQELSARLQIWGVMIGDSTIGKIENGTSAISDIQLVAFAAVLGVSVLWLLDQEE